MFLSYTYTYTAEIGGIIATHLWPSSKSKFNLKSDRVNLVAPASSIEYLLYLPYVWVKQYKLGLDRLTRLGNSNVLRLPVLHDLYNYTLVCLIKWEYIPNCCFKCYRCSWLMFNRKETANYKGTLQQKDGEKKI